MRMYRLPENIIIENENEPGYVRPRDVIGTVISVDMGECTALVDTAEGTFKVQHNNLPCGLRESQGQEFIVGIVGDGDTRSIATIRKLRPPVESEVVTMANFERGSLATPLNVKPRQPSSEFGLVTS